MSEEREQYLEAVIGAYKSLLEQAIRLLQARGDPRRRGMRMATGLVIIGIVLLVWLLLPRKSYVGGGLEE